MLYNAFYFQEVESFLVVLGFHQVVKEGFASSCFHQVVMEGFGFLNVRPLWLLSVSAFLGAFS